MITVMALKIQNRLKYKNVPRYTVVDTRKFTRHGIDGTQFGKVSLQHTGFLNFYAKYVVLTLKTKYQS